MQPIEEYGKGKGRDYGKRLKMSRKPYTDTTALLYGRGFVQLTWHENYDKAGRKYGINLLQNPELALRLDIATKIMFDGMYEGWFTGKKLADYFNNAKTDWIGARRIINGTDKAGLIADHAQKFYACIS
jgi:putative chitinase